ncbi:MAG: DnaA regulatory inactivator Hda [Lysobacterales bacterium CG02_land_8_20_14_3_00_62_12]|nr:MAG: DnaA regulatory inactivator Hda [Xanthomonadales bacterium CG02_land_8_20_14_3_00_62_12]PJA37279.1 MAG: DnaA regulatory inactivator Hda [Xanthomonadales bacterium CG_4_9_14_3_um_filter_62_6]
MSSPQLPLGLRFPSPRRFDNFVVGDNANTLALLKRLPDDHELTGGFLHGPEGSGKTHLQSALVGSHPGALYLPLAMLGNSAELALAAAAEATLICVDQIDAIAGQRGLEIALFNLFNQARERGHPLLLAARRSPTQIGLLLPDLVSRLSSLVQCPLQPLSDALRRQVVAARAQQRGFGLSEAVLEFLFRRFPRDLGAMLDLVDQLDQKSLAEHRRITVPFVRDVIESRKTR